MAGGKPALQGMPVLSGSAGADIQRELQGDQPCNRSQLYGRTHGRKEAGKLSDGRCSFTQA